ncbi:uncharacterized protein AB675_5935 [Cyphellophora attinorum]|uniref:DUF3074 domain-containing protein n=1 Tax=Cyphellophora attinorum TaxID=1664694 RepID=A0A0N0NL70_9EURO|nr:uncharacterized protein AB675_5935 [Phialophora attinorum]KPI38838.1 hypothetical protein AB675_5935 [Phialophora attinorum]
MSVLHDALRSLGPAKFESDVPTSPEDLDGYLRGIFDDAQLVLDTIPIGAPDASPGTRMRSHTVSASNASEMSASVARSDPPAPDRIALQKEWGKPIKIGQKENPLGMSVYKAAGKDGRGAWFARRSVHEGLGFDRFMKAFETEFPTSLAVQGAPGEGNVRGIGAETRVVDITTPHLGKVQVYRLSAQFPGPTTPRDFVTLLLTSTKALKPAKEGELVPRHYMIVSKPCDHPETQPRSGFIRGQYESVEFIREIPRKLKASASQTDLSHGGHQKHGHHSLEHDVPVQNAEKHNTLAPGQDHRSRDPSPSGRKRSHTVDVPENHHRASGDQYDPDENPVEWIMVTRSDPGGSVPRFMVERGTPGSICADAVKFLDWACQQDDDDADSPETPRRPSVPFRRESATSFANQKHLLRVNEETEAFPDAPDTTITAPTPVTSQNPAESAGLFATVAGAVSAYAPQAVQQYLPLGYADSTAPSQGITRNSTMATTTDDNDDASSTISSSLSFASADSHLSGDQVPTSPTASLTSSLSKTKSPQTPHEKELAKLSARRAALEQKHAATVAKLSSQKSENTEKEAAAIKKAEEKHTRELKKQEERYQREVQKLQERKEKDAKKIEARKKRQGEKDEKERLKRERDELKEKIDVLERERDLFMKQVGELQKENTNLAARLGRYESNSDLTARDSDSAKSSTARLSSSSRSSTPVPSVPSSSSNLASSKSLGEQPSLRPQLGAHQRTASEDHLYTRSLAQQDKQPGEGQAKESFGNKMKAVTFHAMGMNEDGKEGGSRSRSGSLFRKKEKEEKKAGKVDGAAAATET